LLLRQVELSVTHIGIHRRTTRSGSVKMTVQLIQNVAQALLILLVGMDEDGLEVDGQAVSRSV